MCIALLQRLHGGNLVVGASAGLAEHLYAIIKRGDLPALVKDLLPATSCAIAMGLLGLDLTLPMLAQVNSLGLWSWSAAAAAIVSGLVFVYLTNHSVCLCFRLMLHSLVPSFFPPLPSPPLPFPSLPFPSLPFPSLPFPSLPFPSLPFPSLPFPSLPVTGSC